MRGLQKTDKDGILQFQTIFPGHYTSRATHIHGKPARPTPPITTVFPATNNRPVLSHPANETTVNHNNNTISGLYTSSSSYVGQLFFDQDLISKVEDTAPYNTNTQELTTNAEDSILSEEADTIDPFVEYVFLGDDVSDGIFSWISLGFDPTASTDVTPAAYLTEEGGIENENSGMGMGGGGGEPPSGSGAPPAASSSASA